MYVHMTSPQKDPSISSRVLLAGLAATVGFVARMISVVRQCEASNSNNSKRAVMSTNRMQRETNSWVTLNKQNFPAQRGNCCLFFYLNSCLSLFGVAAAVEGRNMSQTSRQSIVTSWTPLVQMCWKHKEKGWGVGDDTRRACNVPLI